MSRAFVKEPDAGAPGRDLPERVVSKHPNYVTPEGLAELQSRVATFEARRLELLALDDDPAASEQLEYVDRELRYFTARLESAILVDPAAQPRGEVAFGATVTVAEGDEEHTYRIVGEDEADLEAHKVSYVSPLAQALTGAHVGDRVLWRRPAGDVELVVTAIDYSSTRAR